PHPFDVPDEEPSGLDEVGKAPSLTGTGDLLGTPLYVAPEVIRGASAGRASDLYSFGVIAYEMLVGKPPFSGSTRQVLAGHLEREPSPPAPALPASIWKALREPLAKDPARRPATAGEVVRGLREAAIQEDRKGWRRAELPRRVFLAAVLAAAVPVTALLLPNGLAPVERWTQDLRIRTAPARPPDPRILLVTIDEASLAGSSIPLADWADEIGNTLNRIFAAGARGVAVDMLLPDPWSASPGFSDLVVRHAGNLTLAASSESEGVLGIRSVAGLTSAALGPQRTESLFGFVNLDEDPDGVVRRGRLSFRDRAEVERPSWSARAAGMISPVLEISPEKGFWIDPRIDASRFAGISWRDVPAALATRPWLFRNRLVLVGGDVVAGPDDIHRVPNRQGEAETVSGLVLQALQVDTIVAGLPVREAPRFPFLAGAALWASLAVGAVLLARRPIPLLAPLFGSLLLYFFLSIPVFQRTGLLLPVTVPLLPALSVLVLALVLRRALTPIPSW